MLVRFNNLNSIFLFVLMVCCLSSFTTSAKNRDKRDKSQKIQNTKKIIRYKARTIAHKVRSVFVKAPQIMPEYLQPLGTFNTYQALEVAAPLPDDITMAYLPEVTLPASESSYELRDEIINYAKDYLGTPYVGGGYSKRGFDCSGFTSYVMSHFGYKISRSSSAQATEGKFIPLSEAQKGDLLFFGYKRGKSYSVSHAALVISEKGEPLKMIHAARRGITVDEQGGSSWRAYYAKRLIGARRIIGEGKYEAQRDELIEKLEKQASIMAQGNLKK